MEHFCRKCGTKLIDFCCPACGSKYRVKNRSAPPLQVGMLHDKSANEVIKVLKMHEYISSALWIVIGILQIVFFAFAIMGICNIVLAVLSLLRTTMIKPYKYDVYEYYEKNLTTIIAAIVANVVIGGVVGVVGCIYDIYIRNYVLKNKYAFNRM